MRKMKKINGYLVVRFNDREKRNYPDLGSFGVIDAEQYTGDIDFDRDAMEYTDADCIEVAVEQARGLESESDFSEEPPVCTVIVESDAECSEEEVEPQLMIAGWEQQLETQVESKHYPDIDAKAAAHELHGFKVALYRLGMIDKSGTEVDPGHFEPNKLEEPEPPQSPETEPDTFIHANKGIRSEWKVRKVYSLGLKQWRPDLILCDDLENDENVNTPEQRKKLRDWFYKAVSKAGDTYTDIVYIGTLLHYDALLANVAKNPEYEAVRYKGVISFAAHTELWDAWERIFTDLENPRHKEDAEEFFMANKAEMLEGTAVLWEEKLPYYALMVMRVSEGEASFSSEIQNEPIDPENCAFAEEWFDFYDDGQLPPDFSEARFLFVAANDPSLGKNRKSDTSAIIGIAKDTSTGYMYVVIADIAKRKPDKIIEDAIEASRRLKREYKKPLYKFGVETVQFQYYFAEIMRQKSAEIGEYLPIEEINSIQNKDARIQSLQPFVKNGYLRRHGLQAAHIQAHQFRAGNLRTGRRPRPTDGQLFRELQHHRR